MTRSKSPLSLFLGILATLLIATPALATKYAGEFLRIPVGARAIGLGSAFVAVCDDATASYWNPAGMVYLPYREVIFQHAEKFGSLLNHDYLGAVFPLGGTKGRNAALGVSLIRLASDGIPVTPRASQLVEGIDYYDFGIDNNEGMPDYGQGNHRWDPGERLLLSAEDLFFASSSDFAGLISYARQHGVHWAYGASLKFVRQSIPDTLPGEHVTSFGAGIEAGLLYMPTDAITVGASVHDLTTTYLAWSNGTREKVWPTMDTGVSFNFFPAPDHALTWATDLYTDFENRSNDAQIDLGAVTIDVRTGLEYWYRNTFALRSGANGKDLAVGAGLRYKHVGVDYAASLHRFFAKDDPSFPSDTELDATHLVSIGLSW